MNINDIISVVNEYNRTIPTQFYDDCVVALEELNKKNSIIKKIPEDKFILEPIRLFITNYINDYNIYISSNITAPLKDNTYRKLDLNQTGVKNTLRQLYANDKRDVTEICSDDYYKINTIYCFISRTKINDNNLISITNKIDNLTLLLGTETLKVSEHQDFDRFCGYVNSDHEEVINYMKIFKDFYDFYKDLDHDMRFRTIVFSGTVLSALGTTYTTDIDLMYYGQGQTDNEIEEVKKQFLTNEEYDYHIINNKQIIKRESSLSYLYRWLAEQWPGLVDKPHIKEVIVDPDFHFYFMGIRLISVQMTIERLQQRASPSAFVDMLMLKKINGYESTPCFPNLSIRSGRITVNTPDMIKKKLNTVKNYFHFWHGIETTIPEMAKVIKKCDDLPHFIYKKDPERNSYSSFIIRYHNSVMRHYIKKYLKNDKLLDIGAGPLRQLKYYDQIGIDKLVAIEPSDHSVQKGIEKYNDLNSSLELVSITGYGDEDWSKNNYKPILENKTYNGILFKFTIHYMLDNIDTVLKNISSVDNDDTTIVISCMDGNKIKQKLNKFRGRYEVVLKDEPYYGIYSLPDDGNKKGLTKVMVYFKGVYGLERGSIEYLVDIPELVKKFESIGYDVIENRSFTEVVDPRLQGYLKKLYYKQKLVAELQRVLVFTKKGSSRHMGRSTDNYYKQYKKYKQMYFDLKDTN